MRFIPRKILVSLEIVVLLCFLFHPQATMVVKPPCSVAGLALKARSIGRKWEKGNFMPDKSQRVIDRCAKNNFTAEKQTDEKFDWSVEQKYESGAAKDRAASSTHENKIQQASPVWVYCALCRMPYVHPHHCAWCRVCIRSIAHGAGCDRSCGCSSTVGRFDLISLVCLFVSTVCGAFPY